MCSPTWSGAVRAKWRTTAISASPAAGSIVVVAPFGAVTSTATPERSHPAGHDTKTVSRRSEPTATSAGSSTEMTVTWVAAPAVMPRPLLAPPLWGRAGLRARELAAGSRPMRRLPPPSIPHQGEERKRPAHAIAPRHCGPPSCGTLSGMAAGDAAEHQASRETVLSESALRLAGAIKAGDDLAVDIDHLGVGGGSQARERVVQDRRRPRCVEGRRLDLVHRGRLVEFLVDAGSDEAVVAVHRLLQHRTRHRLLLIGIADPAGEFADRISAEEEPIWVDMRRRWVPLLPCNCIGVKHRPDRAAAVELARIAVIGHRGCEEFVRAVRLVPEPPAHLIYEDDVLPIRDRKAGRFGEMEHGALGLIDQRGIAPPAADVACLGNGGPRLCGLVGGRPQRRPYRHGGKLAVRTLVHIGLAGLLVFLREPRIEHATEIDITGMAAGRNDDALARLDVN